MVDKIIHVRFGLLRAFNKPKQRPRVVLLQGPVGPFFRHLQSFLEKKGYEVLRIYFNAGDRAFACDGRRFDYRGGKADWPVWFSTLLSTAHPDHLIYFGSGREIHRVARLAAEKAGVNVISLEEGYIRPGFVTVECGANNAASPIARQLPPERFDEAAGALAQTDFKGFSRMCLYGAAYFSMHTLFSSLSEREIFHRPFNPVREVFAWARNYYRRSAHIYRNFVSVEKLLEHYHGQYFVIPLQVPADSQMAEAARGWNNARLITAALDSFARCATVTHRLVFKIHPMERGHSDDYRHIHKAARRLGIEGRVDVIDTGSLGLLTRHSAGMITINSTSGLSAIAHGVPLLVIGDALYSQERLAICGHGAPDFDAFWHQTNVADAALRRRYLAWIKASCLKPGDFYAQEGMEPACEGILLALEAGAADHIQETLDSVPETQTGNANTLRSIS